MKEKELARLYYRELRTIHQDDESNIEDKLQALYYLLQKLFIDITQTERIHFTTLFARVAFASHKYGIDKNTQFYSYIFKKNALYKGKKNNDLRQKDYLLGLKVIAVTVQAFYGESPDEELAVLLPEYDFYHTKPSEIKERIAKLRVIAVEDHPDKELFIAKAEEYPERTLKIRYNDRRNENFMPTIKVIRGVLGFPIALNLLDIVVDKDEVMTPRAIVVEPDYLMDVTAVAECFKENNNTEPLTFLLSRFLPKENSVPILLGNIANFFLDELIVNPDLTFDEVFPKSFKISPFAFAEMKDNEIRDVMATARVHFINIKRVIKEGFPELDFDRKNCFLEPSFYSETYGLQGRLDLLHIHPNDPKKAGIIELKSGKPFKPNGYKLSHNHYTQTLLYDLMIKSTYGEGVEPQNYILYSQVESNHLRYAPPVLAQQYEAMNQRNQLIAIEKAIIMASQTTAEGVQNVYANGGIFKRLKSSNFDGGGFLKRDVEHFEKVYAGMDEREKAYFHAFASMIAREHRLAKTGVQGLENANGVASLWLNSLAEKEENFKILNALQIEENHTIEEDPIIVFQRTAATNPLANFRSGDVAVLSPILSNSVEDDSAISASVLQNQVFKGTIIGISSEKVTLRLRARQFNQSVFEQFEHWSIESDMFDSSFLSMYKGLFAFMASAKNRRDLLLTIAAPQPAAENVPHSISLALLTAEQQQIFKKIIASKDYFLLWGPPGTGKTSMMLRHLAQYLMQDTNENVLFLAYTNRAVDEICEAIEANGEIMKSLYLRIGSRYSTHSDFHDNLLEKQMEPIKKRQQLISLIAQKRIFVATVASMNTRAELLKLKKFDTIIIDEASQILEPQIVGLLSQIKRFVLIGDHRQLPAVVSQSSEDSATENPMLHEIGLHNLRNSFFERIYQRCRENEWTFAYDQLSLQGRMHEDLVQFPSQFFYEKNLHILPEGINAAQIEPLDYKLPKDANELEQKLVKSRRLFIPTAREFKAQNSKVNAHEAKQIGELIEAFQRIYAENNIPFHKNSIGVITPYRAQIAQILHVIRERGIDDSFITVDTVERYQGGARDIILISLCTNSASQVQNMISLSSDGVDRKLNVALTRARKHIVVLGNELLLAEAGIYRDLMAWLNE
jgi:DNA replication ATP-dependent helicase Dna2